MQAEQGPDSRTTGSLSGVIGKSYGQPLPRFLLRTVLALANACFRLGRHRNSSPPIVGATLARAHPGLQFVTEVISCYLIPILSMRVTPIAGVLSTLVVARLLGQGTLETELSPGDFAGPVAVEGLAELREAPRLRFCDRAALRLGYIDAVGQILYRIPLSGRPDTASIQVVSVSGVSAEGLRSAAGRYLATCRFDAARTRHGPAPALVRQRLTFTSRKLQIAFVPPADLPAEHPDSAAPEVWSVFAASLDELPRPLACRFPRLPSGRIQLGFVVDSSGRCDPATVRVLQATPEALRARASKIASACRFVPGRVRGTTVPVEVSQVYVLR